MAKRETIYVCDGNSSSSASTGELLTVVSFNVLADCHVDHDMDLLYTKCEKADLYIEGRFDAIVAEVLAYEPDIVCFQEVPPDYYDRKFKPHFDKLGFEGVYMKRVAKTHHEGEATFFKSSKYELVNSVSKSLSQLLAERLPAAATAATATAATAATATAATAAATAGDKSGNSMTSAAWEYVARPDVTVVCHFRSRESGREFVVANVHISFVGYKLRDLQALQTSLVLKALTDMARTSDSSFLPHIVVGDFNQQPGTPGYRILETGTLPDDAAKELEKHKHIDVDDASSKEEAEANGVVNGVVNGEANGHSTSSSSSSSSCRTGLLHLLGAEYFCHSSPGLKSAYFEALKGSEPGVTCVDLEQEDPHQTLDYVWYSHDSLELQSVVDVPSAARIEAEVAFPSQTFPSDHISLSATFMMK